MKKKVLSALLSVAMVATLLVGCGGSSAPAAESAPAEDAAPAEDSAAEAAPADGNYKFILVSKGFQHQFWQAVKQGAEERAKELGVEMEFQGPDSEDGEAEQLQMFKNAISNNPNGIGLAALNTETLLEDIAAAQAAGIPIVGFDSGVPGAPEGAIYANAATNNYKAGELAAEETYKLIKDKLAAGSVIGVMSQDDRSQSVVERGLGFVDKMAELVSTDAGLKVTVTGNDKFVSDSKCEKAADAEVTITVLVPASIADPGPSVTDGINLLSTEGIVAVYGSNEFSANNLITADDNIGKLGKDVVGVGFDAGATLKTAVAEGKIAGAITQSPYMMGAETIQLLFDAAQGKSISDVDTGCAWYTADNMNDQSIAVNLYD